VSVISKYNLHSVIIAFWYAAELQVKRKIITLHRLVYTVQSQDVQKVTRSCIKLEECYAQLSLLMPTTVA